ncbi:MAG: PEP-CTERM sorting domain-containing protein [Bryobacteraceae bacterium]
MRNFTAVLSVAALFSLPSSATVIDDFTTTGMPNAFFAPSPACGSPSSGNVSGTNTMGGTNVNRSVMLENTGNACAQMYIDIGGTLDRLDIGTVLGAQAKATITWDVPFGTPGSPVSFAGDPYITFLAGQDGGSVSDTTTFRFTVCSRDGTCAITTATLTGNTGGNLVSLYANLMGIGLTQAQLADIKSVTLVVEGGPAYDITIDQIMTGIPEPGSMALLGAGLVALGVYRRRKS